MERERVIEIFLGLIFIVLLLLLIFFGIGISRSNGSSNTVGDITNSYNVNSYNTYPVEQRSNLLDTKSRLRVNPGNDIYYLDYYYDPDHDYRYYNYLHYDDDYDYYDKDYKKTGKRYLSYSDYSRLRKYDGVFGNDVKDYEVYVRNREHTGGYFKVIYHFDDYYGREKSYTMTHYIPAREEKKFFFRDVTPGRYEYKGWWYTVEPLSKVPKRVYD